MSDDPFGIRTAPLRLDTAGPAGYVRSSSADRAHVPDVDAQRRILQRYADAESLGDLNWFADTEADGASLDRIGLRRLITAINDGKVTHLLLHSMDRLSSSRHQLLQLLDTYLNPQAVPLISVSEFVDTSTPRGEATVSMLRSFTDAPAAPTPDTEAQKRSAEQRKRVAESGAFAGGRVPFGYRRSSSQDTDAGDAIGADSAPNKSDGVLVIVPEEATIIRDIFAARRDGNSLRSIASMLNERDIPAPSGGRWHASTVRYVLSNETYFGYRTYDLDGETVTQDVPHLQIVDRD
jgi:site-specific DNA recombinase